MRLGSYITDRKNSRWVYRKTFLLNNVLLQLRRSIIQPCVPEARKVNPVISCSIVPYRPLEILSESLGVFFYFGDFFCFSESLQAFFYLGKFLGIFRMLLNVL